VPTLTINGREITVEKGTTLMRAAERLGIHIPHFCYHPYLQIAGNCRMCLVEVEGCPKLVTSCSTEAQDGMVVRTDSPRVRETVRGILELLLINHPVDCPVCDQAGECKLQDYYMGYGFHDSRMDLSDKLRKRKVVDLGEMIMLDAERCVLCSACVRFCQEVSRTNEMQIFNRGNRSEIGTFDGKPLQFGYAGNLADICPVGALTSKDFRFKCRVWFLERTDTVCAECSTGCNIRVDHKDGTIYRFVPRENPAVNKAWMCDRGRLSYKRNNSARLREPFIVDGGERRQVDWDEAYRLVNRKALEIKEKHGGEALAAIVSARATNEELFLFRKLSREILDMRYVDFRVDEAQQDPAAMEDHLLRRKDNHPNTMGAYALKAASGNVSNVPHILSLAKEGRIRFLYLLGGEALRDFPEKGLLDQALRKTEFVVLQAGFEDELREGVSVLLPQASYLETEGTFTNFAGRVQKLSPAFPPPGRAREGWRILLDLVRTFGMELAVSSCAEVFALLAQENERFSGMSHATVGATGTLLDGRLL